MRYCSPMKLITPLGQLLMLIDGKPIEYSITELRPMDVLCPNVEGRYKIEVDFVPNGKEHLISCCLQPSQPVKNYPESGERLEGFGYYSVDGKIKVSIGIESDTGYINDDEGKLVRYCDIYDYDGDFKEEGGCFYNSYLLFPFTKTTHYVFGVAWTTNCNEESDVQTWYGADPTIM